MARRLDSYSSVSAGAGRNIMDTSHQLGVRELDLSNWHTSGVTDKLNHAVPALKSSTGKTYLPFLVLPTVRGHVIASLETSTWAQTLILLLSIHELFDFVIPKHGHPNTS